ncbi:TPA: hypothetical protein N0F65_004220 [Lagenidium giganteum]|uniref:DDE Tnp4 domain-containing protein n=1 Tax=Lagenidium giganteum TaxID=4803 RepID=A0AAV2ZFF7_9STRA|nr:TPA: hypothetical protein N0F65_004220 [Lagenidium giganteum]
MLHVRECDLTAYCDSKAQHLFRFTVPQLRELARKLQLPERIVTAARDNVPAFEALAIVCRRLAKSSRWSTAEQHLGRRQGTLSRICIHTIDLLYERFSHKLELDTSIITTRARQYHACITENVASLSSCMGFIDGTKQCIARPTSLTVLHDQVTKVLDIQRVCYSGHKRRHRLTWQALVTPDDLGCSFDTGYSIDNVIVTPFRRGSHL